MKIDIFIFNSEHAFNLLSANFPCNARIDGCRQNGLLIRLLILQTHDLATTASSPTRIVVQRAAPTRNPQKWKPRWHTPDPLTLIRNWSLDVLTQGAAHSANIHQSKDNLFPSEPLTDAFHWAYPSSNEPFLCQNFNSNYNVVPYGDYGTERVNHLFTLVFTRTSEYVRTMVF